MDGNAINNNQIISSYIRERGNISVSHSTVFSSLCLMARNSILCTLDGTGLPGIVRQPQYSLIEN